MESTTETVEIPGASKVIFDALEKRFGDRLLGNDFFRGELTFIVAPEDFVEVAAFCRDEPSLAFERLDCLTGQPFPRPAGGALRGDGSSHVGLPHHPAAAEGHLG